MQFLTWRTASLKFLMHSSVFFLSFNAAQKYSSIGVQGKIHYIFFYFQTLFLEERMNISDSLHKLQNPQMMSFSHERISVCLIYKDGCKMKINI